MMGDSSEDDCPIGARTVIKAVTEQLFENESSDNSDSPLPEWLSQSTPAKNPHHLSPDSSGSDGIINLLSPAAEARIQPQIASQAGKLTIQMPEQDEDSMQVSAGALPPQKKLASKETKPPVLPTAQAAVQIAAIPEAASAGGRIPIVMPEKLAKGRFLVELETIDGGATDLTGDAGAVGRFSHSEEGKGMLLDLKGCIYSASMAPCATTLCVVNLQQTEAKVECLFDSFVSLRQEAHGAGPNLEEGNNVFMFDDDDNYQMADEGEKVKKATAKRKGQDPAAEGNGPKKKRVTVKLKGGKANVLKKATGKKAAAKGAASKRK